MPVVAMKEMLDRTLSERYGVAASNVLNDPGIDAVLSAAVEESSPVIPQTASGARPTQGAT